jgi:hypothetical protein
MLTLFRGVCLSKGKVLIEIDKKRLQEGNY